MKNKVTFEFRTDPETYKKLAFVAEKEGRNMNNHILHLARTNIAYYEKVHGKIKPADTENVPLPEDGAENEE